MNRYTFTCLGMNIEMRFLNPADLDHKTVSEILISFFPFTFFRIGSEIICEIPILIFEKIWKF